MYIISKNWHRYWFNYIWQSAAAGLVTAIAIYIFYDLVGLFILAGVGSTFFTIFALPNNRTARSRNILGSYVISIIVGLFCFNYFFSYVSGGLSVGLSTFLMVLTDTEHPPAAGIALGLALAVNNGIVYRPENDRVTGRGIKSWPWLSTMV
ncbi:MAG: HPP family protein [Bacillota bacterium]